MSKYCSDEQISHLDASTELKTVLKIDMPAFKIKFYEQDPMSIIKFRQWIFSVFQPRPQVL